MNYREYEEFKNQITSEKLKENIEKKLSGLQFEYVTDQGRGFIKAEDNSWIQLNATHNGVRMEPIQEGQEVIIVIGEHLRRERIDAYIGVESV